MADVKSKVAILGGGVAGLTAAFALSEIDPRGERFEITLYQLGWRLGGKCASGRNPGFGQRIEEHGLHIWAGFYENAFTVMRAALAALGRPPGSPQAGIGDCFKRQNEIFLAEQHDGKWLPWPLWFQPDSDQSLFPGRDSIFTRPDPVAPPLGEMLQRAVSTFEFNHHYYADQWPTDPLAEAAQALAGLSGALKPHVAAAAAPPAAPSAHPLLSMAGHLLGRIGEGIAGVVHTVVADGISHLLGHYHGTVKDLLGRGGLETEFRRYLIMVDFGLRIMDGILRNDCLRQGLHVLDKYEFREMLANGGEMADNALVSSLYDYTFAYENGETPRLSACSAVQGIIRLFMTYKGAFFWKATAGMGDTICTPIYQLLIQRGVRVKFFHQVTGLELTPDGTRVGAILVNEQVALAEGVGSYDPFVPVDGLPSWPSEPHWMQLKGGEGLQGAKVDFEDVLDPLPPPARKLRLLLGQDFDQVVMGMSLASLPATCAPLIAKNPAWAAMTANLGTTRTQALQLWLDCDLAALGGPYVVPPQPPGNRPPPNPMGPILTNYQKPFDTWADMSHLIPAEDWPGVGPKSVAYFCSVMPDSDAPDRQDAANAAVLANSRSWMLSQLPTLWPKIGTAADFRWDLLHADPTLKGEARLTQQFWQANINPSERYVLSLPNTLQFRLESGNSGFANLFLAGDWTKVPDVNAGCVEVATMSGLMAAAALSGETIPIAAPDWLYNRPFEAAGGKPAFSNYGGWGQLPPPPSTCNDATFYAWPLKADRARCQDFIDRSLNSSKSTTRFSLLLDVAFLMLVKTETMFPSTPPWSDEGRMRETDMGFWLLVASHEGDNPIPSGVGWFPAYLLVDNPYATASGREIWGFPKFVGTMATPDAPRSAGPFSATATVIRKFAPTSRAEPVELIAIGGSGIDFTGAEGNEIDILHKLAGAASADPGLRDAAAGLAALHDFVPDGAGFEVPVYFLKQFRTANSITDAAFQSLLKGGLTLDAVRGFGLLSGRWSIELADTDSLPFIRDLGLGTPADGKLTLVSDIGIWGEMDFTVAMANRLP